MRSVESIRVSELEGVSGYTAGDVHARAVGLSDGVAQHGLKYIDPGHTCSTAERVFEVHRTRCGSARAKHQ